MFAICLGSPGLLRAVPSSAESPVFTVDTRTITSQPQSQTIVSGTTASLSVTALGTSLTYQWFQGTSGTTTSPISGAINASYTTPVLTHTTPFWVRVSDGGVSVDSQTATVSVLRNFASWAMDKGLSGSSAGADADPDGDGIPNLIEFALGLEPTTPTAVGLPTLTQEPGGLIFRFTRPNDLTGMSYTVQTSTDLVNWDGTLATTVESSTSTTDTLIASLSTGQPRFFVRLQVTKP